MIPLGALPGAALPHPSSHSERSTKDELTSWYRAPKEIL